MKTLIAVLGSLGILGTITAAFAGWKAWNTYRMVEESGKNQLRAQQATEDLKVVKQQSEIMTRDEDPEDTAKSLDDGTF